VSDDESLKVVVCGGGNGAHVLAPLLKSRTGVKVGLFAPYGEEASLFRRGIEEAGGILIRGRGDRPLGRYAPDVVSSRAEDVIPGARLVIVVSPAFAHEPLLRQIAPYLAPDSIVGAIPSRGGFEYMARDLLGPDITLFGAQTLPWACRTVEFGREVRILGQKRVLGLATSPPSQVGEVAFLLSRLLGVEVCQIPNMLAVTLGNVGQVIHPGIMYSLWRRDRNALYAPHEVLDFYASVDEDTAYHLAAMSDELVSVARALQAETGLEMNHVRPIKDWLLESYSQDISDSSSLARCFQTNSAYRGLKVPTVPAEDGKLRLDFQSRYVSEDVPFGLVVSKGIALLTGTPTPAIDRVIRVSSSWLGVEFLKKGRLKLEGLHQSRAPQRYGINDLKQLVSVTEGGMITREVLARV